MTILGHAVKPWMLWVGGGVAALMVFLYLRNRSQGKAQEAPAGDSGGGSFGAGATAGSAPAQTGGSAGGSDYGSQLNQLQLQEEQQRLKQSQQMFDLQLQDAQQQSGLQNQMGQAYVGYQSGLYNNATDILKGTEKTQIGLQNAVNDREASHAKEESNASADFCPAGTSMRYNPNTGEYMCRNKSGGFAVIGQIASGIQQTLNGLISGVSAAAPGIGYNAANTAAQYYTGQFFGGAPQGYGGQQSGMYAPPGGYGQMQPMGGGYNIALPPQFGTPGIGGGYPGSPVPAGGGRIQAAPVFDPRMVSTMPTR